MSLLNNGNKGSTYFMFPASILILILILTFPADLCYSQSNIDINQFFAEKPNIIHYNVSQRSSPLDIIEVNFTSDYRLDKIIYKKLKNILTVDYLPQSNGGSHVDESESSDTSEEQTSDTATGIAESTTESEDHEHGEGFWHSLVIPLGITTLSFLFLTILSGLFRRKLGRLFMKIHPVLAFITLVLGICHALLVILT